MLAYRTGMQGLASIMYRYGTQEVNSTDAQWHAGIPYMYAGACWHIVLGTQEVNRTLHTGMCTGTQRYAAIMTGTLGHAGIVYIQVGRCISRGQP